MLNGVKLTSVLDNEKITYRNQSIVVLVAWMEHSAIQAEFLIQNPR